MIQTLLIFVILLLSGMGIFLILRSFFPSKSIDTKEKESRKKLIVRGWIGVILLFIAGIIIIYLYSFQSSVKKFVKEKQEENNYMEVLPDISNRDN